MNTDPSHSALLPAPSQASGPYALAIPLTHLSHLGFGPSGAVAAPPRRIIIEDLLHCILRRWKTSAVIAGLLCSVLLFFLLGRQPEFLAEANLIMRIRDDKVFNFERVVDNSSSEATSVLMLLNNHRVEMKSRRFVDFFYSRLTPEQRTAFLAPPAKLAPVRKLMQVICPTPDVERLTPEQAEQRAFGDLCEQEIVDFIKETLILKVSVRHHDPTLAATLANAWVKNYLEYVAHEENTSTRQASVFLREEADQARARVQASEEKLAAYCREKGLVDDAEQLAGDGEKLKVLSTEQTRREVELAEIGQTLSQVDAAGEQVEKLLAVDGFSKIPALSTLRGQLTEKLREREVLQQRYLGKHPALLSFEKAYESLQTEIRSALVRTIGELRNKQTSLTNQVTSIMEQLSAAKGTAAGNGTDNIQRKMLRSQLQSDRALYDKLLTRLEEATVSSRFSEVTHLRLAENAEAPLKAVAPNKPLSLVLAGVSFGSFFIIIPMLMAAGGVLRSQGVTGLLALFRGEAMASLVPASSLGALRQVAPLGTDLGTLPALPEADPSRPESMLFSLFQSTSPARELLDRTASSLLADNSCPGGKAPIVLVTSIRRGEGKSLLASGIGIAAALQNKRVVIVEGNLRRPSVHRFFPRQFASPSLCDAARHVPDVGWNPEVLRYPGSELFTLEAGNSHGVDVEHLFDTGWFRQMLDHLRANADLVILDAPSLREVPESEQLALLATRAIVVGSAHLQNEAELPATATRLLQLVPHLTTADYVRNYLPA